MAKALTSAIFATFVAALVNWLLPGVTFWLMWAISFIFLQANSR